MEGMEMICFQIIANSGGAKTAYMSAIEEAKNGNFEKAAELMNEGDEYMNQGHGPHAELIQKEAAGESTPVSLLLLHAEDQMMGAEQFKALAAQMIDLYKRLEKAE
ncbi:PTS lactose/cellobiose transporter subunit IIA [Erysipelotrichaceae bacterium 51-3]|uniref:PTS lactose/cellobiose transporter subunit IIA n=1 Tax=Allobaculum sp. JKK-2023 TaxID=3108943 RepID=UPI002B055C04|nr:PTS lactose/cellobiose transporter subunit IIA [Allobaculum sp. JKK-2023]